MALRLTRLKSLKHVIDKVTQTRATSEANYDLIKPMLN